MTSYSFVLSAIVFTVTWNKPIGRVLVVVYVVTATKQRLRPLDFSTDSTMKILWSKKKNAPPIEWSNSIYTIYYVSVWKHSNIVVIVWVKLHVLRWACIWSIIFIFQPSSVISFSEKSFSFNEIFMFAKCYEDSREKLWCRYQLKKTSRI